MANPYLEFRGTASFTLETGNTSISWNGTLEYSTDLKRWTTWGGAPISSTSSSPYVLYLRGTGNTYITGSSGGSNQFTFTTTGTIECNGRIDTLLNYQTVQNGGTPAMANYCYRYLFDECTVLTKAPELPATILTAYCYAYMFYGCTSLTTAPALPATNLADHCYYNMFAGCTALTSAPALPATTLAPSCYYSMFQTCTSLTSAPALPATNLADYCYYRMFFGCFALTSTPELPATTLTSYCYNRMFYACISLTSIPELPATTLATYCYYYMFFGCSNIRLSTTQSFKYQTPFRIPTSGTGTADTNALTSMFNDTGGSFTGTPDINTTYYITHKCAKNVELNVKWTENTSMTPSGLTAGEDNNGYVTENVSRTIGNLVHCVKEQEERLTSTETKLIYLNYILQKYFKDLYQISYDDE